MSPSDFNPYSRRVTLPDTEVDLPGRYSINIHQGRLTVFGCDCCEDIETVDKAREVITLIQAWIDAPER